MKIVLALVFFFLSSIQIAAQWVWRNPSIPGNNYSQIQFIKDVGYIACFGGVIKTTDGGLTWQYKHIKNSGDNHFVSFYDEFNGIVTGSGISVTKDGGETWTSGKWNDNFTKHVQWINYIHFVDKNKAIAYRSSEHGDNYFVISYDGGMNWTRNSTNYFLDQVTDIHLFDSSKGLATDYFQGVFKTTNGGINWIPICSGYNFISISFIDSLNGFGLTKNYGFFDYWLFKTTDGGYNWVNQSITKTYILNDLFYLDSLNAVAVGDTGTILTTTNGGLEWIEQNSGTKQNLEHVYFTDADRGYIVCAKTSNLPENIIITTDGGITWNSIYKSIVRNNLKDVSFVDSKIGVAVGDSGIIIRTNDAGLNWNIIPSGTSDNLFHVDITKDKRIIVSQNGSIYKTTDLGLTWQKYASSTVLNKVCFVNDSIGIAISGNAILKTINGGKNWYIQYIPSFKLVDLFFTSEKIGTVVSNSIDNYYEDPDPILTTTNGGLTWIINYFGDEDTDLDKVFFVDSLNGYVAGDVYIFDPQEPPNRYNFILKTTDKGLTWERASGTSGKPYNDIFFIDTMKGFVVGEEIFESTQGAINWKTSGIQGNGFRSIFCIDANNAVVVGDNGVILTLNRDVVPVELSSFMASNEDDKIILNWITSSEVNNSGFEIQKKQKDNNFRVLDFVKGYGTTTESQYYTYYDKENLDGVNTYRLKQINYDGSFKYSSEINIYFQNVKEYTLSQCYPNPFNSNTKVNYIIGKEEQASLIIYDVLGREVKTIFNEVKKQGSYSVEINLNELPSGVYFYKLAANSYSSTKKMILLK